MSSEVNLKKAVVLEQVFKKYVEDFSQRNAAAKVFLRGLSVIGVGVRPLLDHFVFRTFQPKERVREFLEMGYVKDSAAKVFSEGSHGVEVYRNGFAPAILLECPQDSLAKEHAKAWGDQLPYVMAVRVEDIDEAAFRLEKQAVAFLRPPSGKREESLRQIAALPSIAEGNPASYLMFVERHGGDQRFYLPGKGGTPI